LARDGFAVGAVGAHPAKRLSSASSSVTASVYTEIVPDCRKKTLQAIIRGRGAVETVIHSDGWRGYDGLVDVGYSKHFRVKISLPTGRITSTALRAFGQVLNVACKSSTAYLRTLFIYT
jgi:transposase-like protein